MHSSCHFARPVPRRSFLKTAALAAGLPLPLAAVQILWINIVTEGTVTVNLVMDPPDGDEMRRPPVARGERLLDRGMLKRVALMTPAIAGVTLGWFAWRLSSGAPLELARTETFTVLAMCQWFNVLNCQSATRSALRLGVLRNRWLLGDLRCLCGFRARGLDRARSRFVGFRHPVSSRSARLPRLASSLFLEAEWPRFRTSSSSMECAPRSGAPARRACTGTPDRMISPSRRPSD